MILSTLPSLSSNQYSSPKYSDIPRGSNDPNVLFFCMNEATILFSGSKNLKFLLKSFEHYVIIPNSLPSLPSTVELELIQCLVTKKCLGSFFVDFQVDVFVMKGRVERMVMIVRVMMRAIEEFFWKFTFIINDIDCNIKIRILALNHFRFEVISYSFSFLLFQQLFIQYCYPFCRFAPLVFQLFPLPLPHLPKINPLTLTQPQLILLPLLKMKSLLLFSFRLEKRFRIFFLLLTFSFVLTLVSSSVLCLLSSEP